MKWVFLYIGGLFWAAILSCVDEGASGRKALRKPLYGDSLSYAHNFSVDVCDGYKIISVRSPWQGSEETFRYALKPRGAKLTGLPAGIPVVETPIQRIIAFSSVYLPLLDSLGAADKIVGVDERGHVNNPRVRENLRQGRTVEVKPGGVTNYEKIVDLNPDVVFSFGVGDPKYDSHHQLSQRGIPVVLLSSYMEDTPLGRAEWIRFMGYFLEKDSLARALFHRVDSSYQYYKGVAMGFTQKPKVFSGSLYGGAWHVPGGKSFTATLFADAGAEYLWNDNPQRGGVPLSFEAVYNRALKADVWLNPSRWKSLGEGIRQDARYRLFSACQEHKVWNHNRRLNPEGGDDYFETGSANPHIVLRDLIKIFHPGTFPGDSLYFYRKLP